MKLRTIFMSMLAIAALTSCNNDDDDHRGGPPQIADANVAYLSIKIDTHPATRASSENAGANESELKSLYLITFDENKNVVGVPGTNNYFISITPANANPDPVKISASATHLLVVANPGEKLLAKLSSITAISTFNSINTAIVAAEKEEVTGSNGFTMINSGDDTGLSAGDRMTNMLIDISGNIAKQAAGETEQDVIDKAKNNGAKIQIERLAAKLELKTKSTVSAKPDGAEFKFGSWTLDGVNSTFYPCAEKTIISVGHSTGGLYNNNFYTHDPNFTGADGIAFTTINSNFEPVLVHNYTWMGASADNAQVVAYCLENTMAAEHQLFGNATRIVIKGTYYPVGHTTKTGDWFNYAGTNYMNLAELQAAYNAPDAGVNFKAACDKMYDMLKDYTTKNSITLIGDNFSQLIPDNITDIPNGGQIIKDEDRDVIRWYQKGLCYYYYEVRHDNEAIEEMAFGKYGVVRNNWYSLTLNSVNGPGSPWYPEPNNPGPGDPGPGDPIDEASGYLSITVTAAPWIVWDNEINI